MVLDRNWWWDSSSWVLESVEYTVIDITLRPTGTWSGSTYTCSWYHITKYNCRMLRENGNGTMNKDVIYSKQHHGQWIILFDYLSVSFNSEYQ